MGAQSAVFRFFGYRSRPAPQVTPAHAGRDFGGGQKRVSNVEFKYISFAARCSLHRYRRFKKEASRHVKRFAPRDFVGCAKRRLIMTAAAAPEG